MRGVLENSDIVSIYAQFDSMVDLAVLLTGSRSVAEDVVADAMLRVSAKYGSVQNPEASLRKAVVNGCRGQQRAAARRRDAESSYAETFGYEDRSGVEFLDALVSLKRRERVAVVLRYFCDLPDGEIAGILHCALPTVRVLVARGLRNLRKVVGDA